MTREATDVTEDRDNAENLKKTAKKLLHQNEVIIDEAETTAGGIGNVLPTSTTNTNICGVLIYVDRGAGEMSILNSIQSFVEYCTPTYPFTAVYGWDRVYMVPIEHGEVCWVKGSTHVRFIRSR